VDLIPSLSLPVPSLPELLQRLVAASAVIGVHGLAVAALADALGDPGPRYDGRRRLNPLVHLDLFGLLHALFFRLPWTLRHDIDGSKLRGGLAGAVAVTLGASLALAALSALLYAVRPVVITTLGGTAALTANALLQVGADVAIVTAVVHLLPLPPFVGALWAPWGPRLGRRWHAPAVRYAGMALVGVASLAGLTDAVAGPIRQAWRVLLGY